MIVERYTFNVKLGCLEKIIDLALQYKSWWIERNVPIRYYTPYYSPRDVFVVEYEFESLGIADKVEKEWIKSKEYADLIPKWFELAERGGKAEIWEVNKV